jgi:uncharacterized protein YbjT (DUF2867 family)
MRIAVVGGGGTLGQHITSELTGRGHEVRVLSRSSPDFAVDLASGAGLAAALAGCSAVIDASNATSARRASQVLVEGSRKLLAAEQTAGVGHHVGISIVGCDLVPVGYYRVKVEQEQVIAAGPVPYTVVRATQFHELAARVLGAAGKYRLLPVPRMRVQTVAASEVARAVADAAEGPPGGRRIQVAGPEISTARDLARTWRSVTGQAALLLPLPPLPGKTSRALRDGALTTDHADVLGTITFAGWLRGQQDQG